MQSDTYWCSLIVIFPFFNTIGFGSAGKQQTQKGKDNEDKGDYQGDVLAMSAGDCLPGFDCQKILHIPVDEIEGILALIRMHILSFPGDEETHEK
jgi:hypothetical protein